jgi:oxygen-independent coproporphyrinogen-3 oxidase
VVSDPIAPIGLYVHIPFCQAICSYCNFNRGLLDEPLKARYLVALADEIRGAGGGPAGDCAGRSADTIFFGGGTPSLLEPSEVARIIQACRDTFALTADAEITLETNPETATGARLEGFRAAGVNRISFGVQSFDDAELARLGRGHSADRARRAIGDARAAGFDNVSLDLMFWLPGQTAASWASTVDEAIALGTDHLSLYLLELYPNAPLKEEMARAGWSLAPDEDAAEMYVQAMERLDSAGYAQYEISNVARPGRASRHNVKYWTDGEWVGFGCGAHSTMAGVRWKNVSSTDDYIARVSGGTNVVTDRRVLCVDERLGDALFTGLRLTDGIDIAAAGARYGVDVWARYAGALRPYIDEGWLERRGNRLALTRSGMLMANEIMAAFV